MAHSESFFLMATADLAQVAPNTLMRQLTVSVLLRAVGSASIGFSAVTPGIRVVKIQYQRNNYPLFCV
jgi:hypothetical protein